MRTYSISILNLFYHWSHLASTTESIINVQIENKIFRIPNLEIYRTSDTYLNNPNPNPETGLSFVFVPGGVQEVMLLDPSNHRNWSWNCKGFVKMALEYGCPIFPVFCFGLDGS